MKHFFLAFTAIFFGITTTALSQNIDKTWQIDAVKNQEGINIYNVNAKTDSLQLKNGEFLFSLKSKDSADASGNYLVQNNLLIFYFDTPTEKVARYKISQLTDSTLVFGDKETSYIFKTPEVKQTTGTEAATEGIIASEGFSTNSLMRGLLGMVVLLLLSFLLSTNRKAINWKTVGFGLAAQLLLAVGVLKVPFIQSIFETVGKMFVKVLEFTQAGSTFLLGGMMDVSSFGFIFLFQVLPTIIFFSALTSLLFYLGVIQKVVSGMAWVLTKLLGISGAESLSVAGNIFLGQTEAPLMIKAYLEKMTKSEILLVMIGGMATVAGGVLAAYIGFLGGEDEAIEDFLCETFIDSVRDGCSRSDCYF